MCHHPACATACLSLFFSASPIAACQYYSASAGFMWCMLSLLGVKKKTLLVGWHTFRQSRIQYSEGCPLAPTPKHCKNKLLPSPPPHTHIYGARLLVQEGVCSAYFNMNIIILYLAAIRFSCQKPTQASSFYSCTVRPKEEKNHIHFLL